MPDNNIPFNRRHEHIFEDSAKPAYKPEPFTSQPLGEIPFGRYDKIYPGLDNEEYYAQKQSFLDKVGNGIAKATGTFASSFLEGTVGVINGLSEWASTGKFSSFYDNSFNRYIDDINKSMEDALPNYYTHAEKDASWYSPTNLLSGNFLGDKILKNLGYSYGAILGGAAWGSLLKGIGLTSRLIRAGEGLKAVEAVEGAMQNASKLERFGAINKALESTWNSIKGRMGSALSNSDRAIISATGMLGEATVEALQATNEFRNKLITDYKNTYGVNPSDEEMKEINRYADKVGNTVFGTNAALLTLSNYIQLPKILGSSKTAEKRAINNIVTEGEGAAAKFVTGAPSTGNVLSPVANLLGTPGRFLNKKLLGPARLAFSAGEALEEGLQYAAQTGSEDFFNRAYSGKEDADDLLGSIKNILTKGVGKALTDKEGIESILIGGLSGGLQKIVQNVKERGFTGTGGEYGRNTQLAIDALNKTKLANVLQDGAKYAAIGIQSQQLRQQAIANNDTLGEKDYEKDFELSYILPRVKYGKVDSISNETAYYRQQAGTDSGFQELKDAGIVSKEESREGFLQRLTNLENTAKSVNSVYEKLEDKYGGFLDKDGKRLYTPEVIDKMAYATAKVMDYDTRSAEMMNNLVSKGVMMGNLTSTIASSENFKAKRYSEVMKEDAVKVQLEEINKQINDAGEVDPEDTIKEVGDFTDMVFLRQKFIDDINAMKTSPEKFKSEVAPVMEEQPEAEQPSTEKETISVKTKRGETQLEVGTQYFLGKGVDYDKDGLEVSIEISELTILGENSDGTIKIRDNKGQERDISKNLLEDYNLGKVSSLRSNKTANYFYNHRKDIFEYNFGEKFGGKKPGRLEYKNGKLFFVYKNDKGKIRRKEVTNEHFLAQEGYDQPRIKKIGEVETKEQKVAREEFTSAEEIAKQKETLAKNRDARLEIIAEIKNEAEERLSEVTKKLETKKKELDVIQKELDKIGEEVRVAEPRTKREKALESKYPELSRQKIKFNKVLSTTSKSLTKLSRMRESVQDEIAKLTAEKNELEFNLSYFEDFSQNLDELPENSREFLKELREQVEWIDLLIKETGNNINALAKLSKTIENAIKDFTAILKDSLQKFDADYPQYIKDTLAEIQGGNFIIKNFADLKEYLADYVMLEDLNKEISVNEDKLQNAENEIVKLYEQLNQLGDEYNAKKKILDKFESVAAAVAARKAEEEQMMKNQKLLDEALGTADNSVQTAEFSKEFEPTPKKSDLIIPRATMGVVRGKAHQIRANNFGINLNSFPNRNKIRGMYVTSKNESALGLVSPDGKETLTDRLRIDEQGQINEDVKKDEIIALVMVQEDENGEVQLVGEDGQPLPTGTSPLDSAIFQVFPDGDLKWGAEFDNESMFRKDTPQEVKDAITKQYKEWRASILENPDASLHEIEASFGIAENVKDTDGKIIYTTQTSVQDAKLVTEDDLEAKPLIRIPTLPTEGTTTAVEEQGTTSIKVSLGTPLLELPNGLVKLKNRQHTEKEATTIYEVILQLAKNMLDPQVGIKDEKSKRLLNWLQSVVYWGIPLDQNKNRKPAGYNSVFFEKDETTGKFMLSISGKGKDFVFTPSSLEENREAIILLLSNMYNNINNRFTKLINEPYEEILSISESGEVIGRLWKNYQSYLLSNTTPDGKKRSGEELPLSTIMKPITTEGETNRTGVYFYTTDTADNFTIPVIEKKKTVVTPAVLTPGAPKPAAPTTTYVLDNKTQQTYISPAGKKIVFIAPSDTTEQNYLEKIKILKLGDFDEVVEKIKSAGKDPALQLKTAIFNAIVPTLNKIRAEEEELSVKIPGDEDEFSVTIPGGEDVTPDVPEAVVADAESKTGKPVSQSVIDAINQRFNAANNQAMRLMIKKEIKAFVPENWNDVESWLKEKFPLVPVYRVKNIIQATNGRQAWGMFKDGAIYIYENAEVGTVYHEVFHAVWRMFSSPEEQIAVLAEMKARKGTFYDRKSMEDVSYSKATDEQLEEKLAEEFRDYVQFKKIPTKPEKGRPFILKLFADMVTAIKEFFFKPTSDSKVAEMFSKINQGGYKSNIPFASSLAFANRGVIDIEEAFADEDSALSVTGMSDKQRSDIIQQMTYLTINDVIKTDDGLFNLEKLNKKEHYASLKDRVLTTIAQKITILNDLVKEKVFTQEEINPQLSATVQLMQSVDDNWDAIVKKHREQLKSYQIDFDENDNMILKDENNSGRGDYQDPTKMDNFKKANSAIKLLLASIPEANEDGTIVPSTILGAKLLPISKTYISLMNNLHTSSSVEEMLNRLRLMAVSDPNYRALYRRITKRDWKDAGVDLSTVETESGLKLISAIWNTFKKQSPDVKNVFILENGEIVVGDANLSSAAQQLRSEYINSIVFKAKDGDGFFTYNDKEKAFVGDPEKLKGVGGLDSPTAMVKFLNKVGIPFTAPEVVKMNPNQLKNFKTSVLGIKESISKSEKISTFSGKALGISGRLFELALIRAAISNPEFSATYFNVSGERTQTFIGTNAASNLQEFLSKIDSFTKEAVGGSPFSYLLTDSFAQNSNLLSRMFTSSGIRKKGTEDLFTVGYVGGTVNEEKGKRKESANLTYKERLVQELNLNLKGWFLNLVPGDASIEWMINLGNAVSMESVNRGMTDINNIFKGYFISELMLVRENRPVAKERKSNEMRFFKGILGETLHDKVVAATGTPEEVYKEFEDKINEKLAEFMEKDMNKLKTVLSQYGILSEDETGFEFENINIPSNLTEKELDKHLMMLTVNYMIANIEMHKLLYSDPYQYEDELKRIKSFNSPRQAIISNSPKMNTALNKVWNKGYDSKDIGSTNFGRDYFRTATHADVIGVIDLPNYEPFKETDGSGIISMKSNRNFRIRSSDWNTNEERQYRYDVAWEKNDKGLSLSKEEQALLKAGNPGVQSAYRPIKPIVSGSKLAEGGKPSEYNDVVLDKFALYPLSYRILKQIDAETNALKLYDKMQKEDIDYIVFNSGRKVGAESLHQTYKEDGSFNNDPYKTIVRVPFSIMSVQAEVPSKEENLVTRGSQITKLITLDFMEAGVPVDFFPNQPFENRYARWYKISEEEKIKDSKLYEEIKHNQDLLEEMIKEGYKETLSRLGIKEIIEKDRAGKITGRKYQITDISKAAETLREEMLKREVNDNISDALDGFLKGETLLEATPAYQQVKNIIYSIADKQFISPKISGSMKVQIPSTLMEKGMRSVKDGLYESDVLKFYEKDGKRVAEVMLPRWFESDMSDEKLLKYLNTTPEGQKILSGVGYRIPTQKQNSVDVIFIKKFLPKEFGDSVVIPAALVQKVGSDFDIDKLSIYLKNVYVVNGKPFLIPYFGIGEEAKKKIGEFYDKGEFLDDKQRRELERYIAEETFAAEEFMEDESSTAKFLKNFMDMGNLFSEEEMTLEFTKAIPAREQIINKLYKKSLENAYVQSMENLISSDYNYENLIKPNSAESLKKLSKEIAEKTIGQSFDYKNVENMLDRTFMSRLRHAFVRGKYAIGIAAVNQTNHSLNQRQPIYIDKTKMSLLSEEDRFWLGDANIKFEQYNSINIDDRMVPTLSMIKNKAGEYISDIIGQFIDGYVDISKGPWIMELGATPNVSSTWLFLVKLGVPIKTVAYFMNQPIVRDYLRTIESAGYSWLFIDSFVDLMNLKYDHKLSEQELSKLSDEFRIPSQTTLQQNVGKSVSDMSSKEKLDQVLMLKEFLKYAKMAEHMFHVTQGSNYDTSTFNDGYLVFKKQMQQIKAQNTIISSVDTLLSNSFIGKLAENITNVRDAFSKILLSDTPKVRGVIQKVLMPFVETSDRDFVKLAQKAVNDLFDWAVQNDQHLNDSIKDILINKGGVSKELSSLLNEIKKKGKEHPLYGNEVIDIIEGIPSLRASGEGVNNVRLNMAEKKVYNQNNIIYAFRELRDYLKGEDSDLYNRIKTLAILQSGLSSSPISFTSLLPYEDFKDVYEKTLLKLEGMSNLEDFYNLGVFQRTNWNNDDIVPYAKAALIKTSSGSRYYNPSMKFLPDAVKEAVDSEEIPPILTRSKRNRESNSDYIVYTWEKMEDILTGEELAKAMAEEGNPWGAIKRKKAAMRKQGDYSYIKKGLFKKVYDNFGKAVEHEDYKGKKYFVYKAINAWGDSFRAKEFWSTDHKSVIDNGFLKVEDVDNNVIITKLLTADSNNRSSKPTTKTPEFDKLPAYNPEVATMTYAGIGSRETPKEVLEEITKFAAQAEKMGFTLNTGVTFRGKEEGVDGAFSRGTKKKYLASPENQGSRLRERGIAMEIHPNPTALVKYENGRRNTAALSLMARNTNQIFGDNLDTPVDFVLFYAKETGSIRPEGGTGQAVEMARKKGIPTINIATTPNWREEAMAIMNRAKSKKRVVAQPTPAIESRSLVMQPDNIAKIKAGTKTITNRTEKFPDGIYTLPDGTQVKLTYQGQADVQYIGDSVIVTANDTNKTWGADEFAKAEGFKDWSDFQKNNKFSKSFIDGKQSRYIYAMSSAAPEGRLAELEQKLKTKGLGPDEVGELNKLRMEKGKQIKKEC